MSESEKLFQQSLFEIFTTEHDFVLDLQKVVIVFLIPITEKKALTTKNINLIFGNIKALAEVNKVPIPPPLSTPSPVSSRPPFLWCHCSNSFPRC